MAVDEAPPPPPPLRGEVELFPPAVPATTPDLLGDEADLLGPGGVSEVLSGSLKPAAGGERPGGGSSRAFP